ncbi:oligopeptide/dipeptide ABC transporter ATP-binding protein [Streptomyces stramineus]
MPPGARHVRRADRGERPRRAGAGLPSHPYTEALLAACDLSPGSHPRAIAGTVPAPADLPAGCVFRDRCAHADDACAQVPPAVAATPAPPSPAGTPGRPRPP